MPSRIYDRWDVVVVPFPFTDIPVSKVRPALVLSDAAFQRGHGHHVLAMVTTAAGSSWPSDIPLREPGVAGLPRPCVIRLKLFTLTEELIQRKAGALAPADRKAASRGLAGLFERAEPDG